MHFLLGLIASLLIVGDATKLSANFANIDQNEYDDSYINGRLDLVDDLIIQELDKLTSKTKTPAITQDEDDFGDSPEIFLSGQDDDFRIEKKSSKLRTSLQTDRGNRDMSAKFRHEMVQCHGISHKVNLTQVFGKQSGRVQFHEYYDHFHEIECVRVGDDDKRRIKNPCVSFPQASERLCYLGKSNCETLVKTHLIWMRDRYDDNVYGPWYPELHEFKAGCHCNYEFHY